MRKALVYRFAVSVSYMKGYIEPWKHVSGVETLRTCLKIQKRKDGRGYYVQRGRTIHYPFQLSQGSLR